MAARRPTILDVARAAGVSTATVSRVINGSASVDREMTRKVRSAVRSTGYVPNAAGRSLRRGSVAQIAVVIPDAENPYFAQVISEVERMARTQGYSVSVSHTEDDLAMERECFAQLVARQVAGVVLTAIDGDRTDITPLLEARLPLVLVDRQVGTGAADLVATDNLDAGTQAASHLHGRGFRRPVVIAGPERLHTTEERASGFLRRWRALGVDCGADQVWRGDLQLESGAEAMGEILSRTDADCVYVTNNRMSAGAFEACRARRDAGKDPVPALLGTDDDVWTRLVTPSVSVVQQPIRATGRAAARMLGQRMADPDEAPSTVLLRSHIVERESTAPRA
jgi:LacI family transcriptional regulator